MTKQNILMVLTSHSDLGNTGEKTGFWVEEFAAPYYAFLDAGATVTLATPAGGQPPIDPSSELPDFQTAATQRFDNDESAKAALASTLKLSDVSSDNFDGIFYPGGHGPLWDLTESKQSIALIQSFLKQDKPVASVCHATAVLLNVTDENGDAIVKGKAVTGFSNTEEEAVGLIQIVPFLLEDELKNKGGDYQKVDDWNVLAVQDGLLITGQNPASSEATAEKLLAHLAK
ncbi:type 1 glutamine amidotransferase domain-containing protein [Vibrio rumoiensis]|uniref:Dimethylallyltransferase n=1 Tax=Vibrio rumoiensis 1S-45 TaxID=1188252 RepID=A0A1E5E0U3_9VIBR|nr:type 1 glutamine amidotransferase domain-containing protein [Vibrio rumoiensis]OEF24101.1 dimethylallyltransferase [Vibrio rumoiensis 1S-45]